MNSREIMVIPNSNVTFEKFKLFKEIKISKYL